NIYGPIDDYDYYDFLRSLVEDLNIENYFIFHRETWNVNDALKEIDIFAMPSLIEGLPFSLIEATAMGIPSVVTNVGGVSEVISNLGYYVPKNNSSALAKGIMRAKEEYTNGKYNRKKVLRRNYITNNFSIRNFSDELLRVYESLLYCF
ncbi:MAG: glycosyltransferase family 4 protein, partial [Candidatus Odinarchaeota archaeon]|nr:glycosyltransferase family 4 protein [Candidatus Odinarchaeota archaeon]